ncbi:MAG: tetratricopeptide repeat protein [Candidatus Omnitrophica bacterium]|nr:tetratricopeptide repeat protein [Candidatus Omnitrophota bacterium]
MPTESKREIWLSLILIITLGFVVYANSLDGEFIWDDEYLIIGNPHIKTLSGITDVFTKDIGAGAGHQFNFYRPLQMLTYMIDNALWGLNTLGYHLSSVILHVLVALSLYWLVLILFKDSVLSLLTSILFVVHPVHTEAVSYISGRSDPLSLCFLLLCFVFYIKNLDRPNFCFYLAMIAAFICAVLSKENALILPILVLLYHYSFKRRLILKQFLPLLLLTCFYSLLRMTVFDLRVPGNIPISSLAQRLPGAFVAIMQYARILIFPFDLHMEYGNKFFAFTDSKALVGMLIVLSCLTYVLANRHKRGLIFFGLLWFFIALLPVSNLFPINAYMAEHWLYLPSIGIFLIAARGLKNIYDKGLKDVFIVVLAGVLIFYSTLTIMQNRYWQSQINFYQRTLHFSPRSIRMHNGLGFAYYRAGRQQEAIAAFKWATKVFPKEALLYNNLGAVYYSLGKAEPAMSMFYKAVELDPGYAEAYSNLALVYFKDKNYKLAIENCDKAKEAGLINQELIDKLKEYR